MTDHVSGDEPQPQDHEGHTRVVVHMPDRDTALRALGQADATLRLLEQSYPNVRITVRDMDVALDGPVQDTRSAAALLEELVVLAQRGTDITERTVMRVTRMLRDAGYEPRVSQN